MFLAVNQLGFCVTDIELGLDGSVDAAFAADLLSLHSQEILSLNSHKAFHPHNLKSLQSIYLTKPEASLRASGEYTESCEQP